MTDPRRSPLPWLLAALLLPLVAGPYYVGLLALIFIQALVTLGLVLLTGMAGLISFGQAAFVGVGAYVTAWLTTALGWSPWLTLPAVIGGTAAAAAVIGLVTLRMRGHFLALATLAWGISVYFLLGGLPVLGGFNGLSGIPPLSLAGLDLRGDRASYYLALLFLAACLQGMRHLLDSRVGRAIRALRHGSALPESFGADAARLKLAVFVIAAGLAGLSGWLYAHVQRFVNPTPFNIQAGIDYLFMTVVGGAGSVWGAIAGTLLVTVLKQWLQDLLPQVLGRSGNFEIVVFGLLMLGVLHHARDGLWPTLAARFRPAAGHPHVPPAAAPPARDPIPEPMAGPATGAGQPLLEIAGIHKSFGGLIAVDRVSFAVAAGEIVVLLGPNGAGKSTLFNLVGGALGASGGTIRLQGRRIDGCSSRAIARLGVARTFQHVKLVPSMTVLENVMLGAYRQGRRGILAAICRLDRAEERRTEALARGQLARVGLLERAGDPAGALPLGQQRILEIARALAADPLLLLLDEPAAGLRYKEKQALADLLHRLKAQGMTTLLVEHDMDFVFGLADRFVVLHYGRKLADGAPAVIRNDPAVQAAYLGAE